MLRSVGLYICTRLSMKKYILIAVAILLLLWIISFRIMGHDDSGSWSPRPRPAALYTNTNLPPDNSHYNPSSQARLRLAAQHLTVHVVPLENSRKEGSHLAIKLTNAGKTPIKEKSLSIYFHHMNSILKVLKYTLNQPDVTNVKGTLKRIAFPQGFSLRPGETESITVVNRDGVVAKTDMFPNWYLIGEGTKPIVINSTRDTAMSFVGPFDTRLKWKRDPHEEFDPVTVQRRYDENEKLSSRDNVKIEMNIVPTPHRMIVGNGHTTIDKRQWVIVMSSKDLMDDAKFLAEKVSVPISSIKPKRNFISLSLWDHKTYGKVEPDIPESYHLEVDTSISGIFIIGRTCHGVFSAIQTLLSLMDENLMVPEVTVRDKPRFPHRALMLDVVRHFVPKEEVLKVIDLMAMYKLNKLHLHLSDDENWRLQIPGLPELTEMGATRCHDLSELKCLHPQLGTEPDGGAGGSGFYTVDDYVEILRYANRSHIEVIPELDMPGHARAAIKSMSMRFRNEDIPEKIRDYRLIDPKDSSVYQSFQDFSDNAINPCMDSTYRFVDHVLVALIDLHKKVTPMRKFHIGGDEVPSGAWVKSPACETLKRAHPEIVTVKDLHRYFVKRVHRMAADKKLDFLGWEDAFLENERKVTHLDEKQPTKVYANAWKTKYDWGMSMVPYRLANAGYKVIMSHATHLYLDQPHEVHPEERGNYWAARSTSPFKVFSFMPESTYENVDLNDYGHPIPPASIKECIDSGKCDSLTRPDNIIGMQASIWTEEMTTTQILEEMLAPRILMMAERAWHKADWETVSVRALRKPLAVLDWMRFCHTLVTREFKRLEKMKFRYYLPPPGAVVSGGKVIMNTMFDGMRIVYSDDEGATWKTYDPSNTPMFKTYLLATESLDGQRRSRSVKFDADKI